MKEQIRYNLESKTIYTWNDFLQLHNDINDVVEVKKLWENLPIIQESVYDSKADTLEHIKTVNKYLLFFVQHLLERAKNHDTSKLESPEKELFDIYTPILKDLKYGSEEYKESLDKLKPALDHHYKNNSHHPEFHKDGINDMDLLDLVEMFFDWKAATERTKDGDLFKSITINSTRFNMDSQLIKIFINTIKTLNL